MNPGKLDRRITLQSRSTSRDETGALVETWTTAGELWAEVVTQRGREAAAADSERPIDSRTFRIRWRTLSTTGHRIVYQGLTYNITAATEEGRKAFLLVETTAAKAIPA